MRPKSLENSPTKCLDIFPTCFPTDYYKLVSDEKKYVVSQYRAMKLTGNY